MTGGKDGQKVNDMYLLLIRLELLFLLIPVLVDLFLRLGAGVLDSLRSVCGTWFSIRGRGFVEKMVSGSSYILSPSAQSFAPLSRPSEVSIVLFVEMGSSGTTYFQQGLDTG